MCPDRLSRIESALEDVTLLLDQLEASTEAWQPWIERVAPEHRDGARNLVHYWSMRQVDVRDLQARLSRAGKESPGSPWESERREAGAGSIRLWESDQTLGPSQRSGNVAFSRVWEAARPPLLAPADSRQRREQALYGAATREVASRCAGNNPSFRN